MTQSSATLLALSAGLDSLPLLVEGLAVFIIPLGNFDETALLAAQMFLSAEEREKYRRFTIVSARQQYGVARILLRLVLARHLKCEPQDIVISLGAYGKPYIQSAQNFNFSISHCDGCLVVAIARGINLGVDVESIAKKLPNYDLIAQRFYSLAEYEFIKRGTSDQQFARFIELWTLKEAYLKAVGHGLNKPLQSCEFIFSGDAGLDFVDSDPATSEARGWYFQLYDLLGFFRLCLATSRSYKPHTTFLYMIELSGSVRRIDMHSVDIKLLRSGQSL